jgi:hypothetical protein
MERKTYLFNSRSLLTARSERRSAYVPSSRLIALADGKVALVLSARK